MNTAGLLYFLGSCFLLSAMAITARSQKPSFYPITKPLPVLWMIIWTVLWLSRMDSWIDTLMPWILTGLIFGLAGDVFLLKKETFLLGYTGFIGGHLAYVLAFAKSEFILPWYIAGSVFIPGVLYAIYVSLNTLQKKMMPIVWIYSLIISGMLLFAINTGWKETSGWLLTTGCLLFFISDGFWSWNKFVKKLPQPGAMILSTYYTGQALITYGSFLIISK